MDSKVNEVRVTDIAVGQWSRWNMDGALHEERIAQIGVGQQTS